MSKSQISLLGSLLAAGALVFAGCGGGSSGGGTGGKVDGGGTGGKGTGGVTAGTGGRVDGGGTGGSGTGGATDGGVDRTDSGAGGASDAGDAGIGDTGTDVAIQTVLYDFENGVQGWGWNNVAGATTVASTDQAVDGVQSLKASLAPAPEGGTPPNGPQLQVNNTALWPGTVLTFHAFFPVGTPTDGNVYFQVYTSSNNYQRYDNAGNSTRVIMPGAFTTWTYTVPNTFPGGLQVLGFQIGDNSGGVTIAGKTIYLDAITATGGVQNCAVGTGTGSHDFEISDAGTGIGTTYQLDNNLPTAGIIAISQSADQAFTGTQSLKVALTGLPASTTGGANVRNIYIGSPNIYCGQTATFHVFMPTGSDGITFQAYAQYNAYGRFTAMGPTTVTRNAFNTFTYTIPADVGPGGIQRLGVQIINNRGTPDGGTGDGGSPDGGDGGTADGGTVTNDYTGNVYIDAITW